MLYSKYCEYSIRALTYLCQKSQNNEYVMIKDISEQTKIPYHFLSKIFQDLANTSWVDSKKGKKGGVTLKVDAKALKLIEIIKWSDGLDGFKRCIIGGDDECGRDIKCNMHHKCSGLRNQIMAFFEHMSIYDVAEMDHF